MPEGYEPATERVSTGIAGLDEMLGGGVWRGTTTLLAGPSGAGKTTIGLQFALEGARQGEPTLYLNFQENPTQLIRTIRALGVDLEEAQARGLELVYASPVELQIDSIIVDMFRRIQQRVIPRIFGETVIHDGEAPGGARQAPAAFAWSQRLLKAAVIPVVPRVAVLHPKRAGEP